MSNFISMCLLSFLLAIAYSFLFYTVSQLDFYPFRHPKFPTSLMEFLGRHDDT